MLMIWLCLTTQRRGYRNNTEEGLQEQHRGGVTGTTQRRGYRNNTEEGLQEQHRGGVTGTTQRLGVTGTTQRRGYRNNTEEGLQEQHRGGVTGTTQRRGYRNNTEEGLQEQHRGGVTGTTQRRGYGNNTEEGLQEQHRGGVTGTTQRRGYRNNTEEGLQEQHRGGVTGTTQRRGYRNNTEEGLQEQHRGGVTGTTQRRGYRNNTEEGLQEQHRGGVTGTTQRRGYRKPPTRGGVPTQRGGYRNNTEEGLQEQHRGGVTGTTQRRGYRNNTEEGLQEQHRGGVTGTTQRRGYRKPPTSCANTAHMLADISQRPYCRKDTLDISVEGLPIEQVSNFTYLGTIISADGTIDKELSSRIQKVSGAFYQSRRIWCSRNIKTPIKVRIYKAAVLTILLYGSEVWNTTQAQMKRFEVFHQRCLRKILKIRWNYFVSNAEARKGANIAPVNVHIRAARLRCVGYVVRMPEERVPNCLLDWIPMHGKRSRGRPRENWLSCVLEDAASIIGVDNISLVAAKQNASGMVHWKNLIHRN